MGIRLCFVERVGEFLIRQKSWTFLGSLPFCISIVMKARDELRPSRTDHRDLLPRVRYVATENVTSSRMVLVAAACF